MVHPMTIFSKLVGVPLAPPRDEFCGYALEVAYLFRVRNQLADKGVVVQLSDIEDILCHVLDIKRPEGVA